MAHGTLAHRLWDCMHPALIEAGSRQVPPEIVAQARAGIASGLCAQWERALLLVPDLQLTAKGPFDTFQWTVMAEGGAIEVTFYPDGSRCGGRDPLLGSFGWAFAARDAQGKTVAAVHGKPPRWVRSVPGAETWVFAEAASASIESPAFRIDCLGVAMVGAKGGRFASSARQLCASAWNRLFSAIDDSETSDLNWIPAHTAVADVDVLISAEDRDGNDEADTLAKAAANAGAASGVDAAVLRDWDKLVCTVAKWIGVAGVIVSKPGQRDTLASQALERAC